MGWGLGQQAHPWKLQFHLCLCRLLNSNKFTLIGDNAFTGLSHLQYLCVGGKGAMGKNKGGGPQAWEVKGLGRDWMRMPWEGEVMGGESPCIP